jgi:hypothetical protein
LKRGFDGSDFSRKSEANEDLDGPAEVTCVRYFLPSDAFVVSPTIYPRASWLLCCCRRYTCRFAENHHTIWIVNSYACMRRIGRMPIDHFRYYFCRPLTCRLP